MNPDEQVSSDPESRRRALVRRVIQDGGTPIELLAQSLGVSVMTVYRDLAYLESQHLVSRRRGEVLPASSSLSEAAVPLRLSARMNIKRLLAQAAVPMLRRGMTVLLDDSTSALGLMDHLAQIAPVTVVTNAEFVAARAREAEGTDLLMLGGQYVSWADSYFGDVTEAALSRLHVDLCVMSSTAITAEACFHPEEQAARTKRAMLQCSQKKILLADSTKFERTALYQVAPLTTFDCIIADRDLPQSIERTWCDAGIDVRLAGEKRCSPSV